MKQITVRKAFVPALVVALGLLTGSTAIARPSRTTEVKQVGESATVYRGPDLNVELGYRFAKANPGAHWLILDVGMNAEQNDVAVSRGEIAVRTPAGEIVPLASQEAFGAAYPKLAATIQRANIAGQPLGYLTPQAPRRLEYFTEPGRGLAYPTVWLDDFHNTYGRLYFQIPDGVQPGAYQLLINLPDHQVVIPFTL